MPRAAAPPIPLPYLSAAGTSAAGSASGQGVGLGHWHWLGLLRSPHSALLGGPGQPRGHRGTPAPQQHRAKSITDPVSPYFGRIPRHGTT